MDETPPLTTKIVKCAGGELFKAIHDLELEGWRPSMIEVKGVCDYTVTANLVRWIDSEQPELM